MSRIPQATREEIEITEEETKDFDDNILNIALNYGSRAEIVRAAQLLAAEVKTGARTVESIDEEAISGKLYTAGQPDPDLMIRTSGEQRISNYLLWQLAYSELIFIPVPWPEFTRERFAECLNEFAGRERRFGLTGQQLKAP